jgi:single-stranded-DNA-specific exonuclease
LVKLSASYQKYHARSTNFVQLAPTPQLPQSFLEAVKQHTTTEGYYAAQLLWQRGIHNLEQLPGFLNPDCYQPASPFEFGQEMDWAVARLQEACKTGEMVAIWGDFDADGITSTAVLWEGLGQFIPQDWQLIIIFPIALLNLMDLTTKALINYNSKVVD